MTDFERDLRAFEEALARGESRSGRALLLRFPEHAEAISALLKTRILDADDVLGDALQRLGGGEARFAGALRGRPPIRPGEVIGNEYRVANILGGGMGVVYLAERLREPRRQVAIKTVPEFAEWRAGGRAEAPRTGEGYLNLLRRFEREALAWVRLGFHPNIVLAHKVIEDGGKPYLVLGFAAHGDLSGWIRKRVLTVPKCVNFAIQFCRGMRHAVERLGMIHRDIKPANILLDRDGLLKVTDFGLARVQLEEEFGERPRAAASPDLSEAGAGTFRYMAPEQFESLSLADTRSDLFSFGATLFEMLTGDGLFSPSRPSWAMALLGEALPDARDRNPDVPRALSEIVAACCDYDPARRPRGFAELEEALWTVQEALPDPIPIPEDPDTLKPELHTPMIAVESESYALISLGRYEEAAETAAHGTRLDPLNSSPWINLSKALVELKRFPEARRCAERAVELDPGNQRAWANLGWGEYAVGEVSLAAESAERATRLDPAFPDAWACRGSCAAELGDLEAARAFLDRAKALSPNEWRVHAISGQVELSAGNKERALAAYETACRLNPGDGGLALNLALLRSDLGNVRGAFEAIEAATALAPENADAWAAKALLLFDHRGDVGGARDALARAEALNPGSRALSSVRNRVPAVVPGWNASPTPASAVRGARPSGSGERAAPEAVPEIFREAARLRRDFSDPANLERAGDLFRQGIRDHPASWVGVYGLGEVLTILASRADGEAGALLREAVGHLETALRLQPGCPVAALRLARTLAPSDFARARSLYESLDGPPQGAEADPLYPEEWAAGSHWEFAIVAAERGATDLAIDAFCEAIQLSEDYYARQIEPRPGLANLAWRQALHRLDLR